MGNNLFNIEVLQNNTKRCADRSGLHDTHYETPAPDITASDPLTHQMNA